MSHKLQALSWAALINRPYENVDINWIERLAGRSSKQLDFACWFLSPSFFVVFIVTFAA